MINIQYSCTGAVRRLDWVHARRATKHVTMGHRRLIMQLPTFLSSMTDSITFFLQAYCLNSFPGTIVCCNESGCHLRSVAELDGKCLAVAHTR